RGVPTEVLVHPGLYRCIELPRAGQPFMLTTLTLDTHHPAGHLPVACKRTRYPSPYGEIGLLEALKCSDHLSSQLVQRIRDSEFGDSTLVVVASDQLAVANHLSHALDEPRRATLLLRHGTGSTPG